MSTETTHASLSDPKVRDLCTMKIDGEVPPEGEGIYHTRVEMTLRMTTPGHPDTALVLFEDTRKTTFYLRESGLDAPQLPFEMEVAAQDMLDDLTRDSAGIAMWSDGDQRGPWARHVAECLSPIWKQWRKVRGDA